MLGECRGAVADARQWIDAERTAMSVAEDELIAAARVRAGR
jgi:hypothetical protein